MMLLFKRIEDSNEKTPPTAGIGTTWTLGDAQAGDGNPPWAKGKSSTQKWQKVQDICSLPGG